MQKGYYAKRILCKKGERGVRFYLRCSPSPAGRKKDKAKIALYIVSYLVSNLHSRCTVALFSFSELFRCTNVIKSAEKNACFR